jgi:SPP1 gp7 family putative phage head morphogenesis protein
MKVRTTKTRPPRPRGKRPTANARTSPLRRDPTRTASIRRRWEAEVRRRFARLKASIIRLVVDEDAFGLAPPASPFAPFVGNARFAFQTSPQLQAFKAWLASQVQSDVIGRNDDTLWRKYVEEGFRQGASRAFADVRKPAAAAAKEEGAAFYEGGKEEFLRSAFAQPVAVEKVQLLASRTLNELEGVTDQMATAMVRTLADGLVRGQSPREIAADLADDAGIGKGRALNIVRTELSRSHSEGQLMAMEALGVDQLGVDVEWLVTEDERLCPICADLAGKVFTLEEAKGMLPIHPG